MRTTTLISLPAVLLIAGRAFAQVEPNHPSAALVVDPLSTDCRYNFTSGSGERLLRWCVSTHGNLMRFESPAKFEHIRVGVFWEGYVVCQGTNVLAYDTGSGQRGCGKVTVLSRGPASVSLRRVCDGFQLDQTFTRDPVENDVTITMKVTNLTGATVPDVRLARVYDADNDNDFGDDLQDLSIEGAWAREIHASTLTGTTFERRTNTSVYLVEDGAACSPPSELVPTFNDWWTSVTYRLGTMDYRASRTVKYVYRRQ